MRKNSLFFIMACLTLLFMLSYTKTLNKEEIIPIVQPIDNMPNAIGDYLGENDTPKYDDSNYRASDEKLLRVYTKKGIGTSITVFVGYWETQNKYKKIGPPRYTGKDWGYTDIRTKIIDNKQGQDITMQVFMKEKGSKKILFYYCYMVDRETVSNEYKYRFIRMVNSLFYKRNNAALVTVSIPITPDFPVEAAEPYIEDFIKDFLPIVKEYVPK
jgi:EpsI family protein